MFKDAPLRINFNASYKCYKILRRGKQVNNSLKGKVHRLLKESQLNIFLGDDIFQTIVAQESGSFLFIFSIAHTSVMLQSMARLPI